MLKKGSQNEQSNYNSYSNKLHTLQENLLPDLDLLSRSQDAEAEQVRLDNKARFIAAVVAQTLRVSGRKRADIETDMEAQGFTRLSDKPVSGVSVTYSYRTAL